MNFGSWLITLTAAGFVGLMLFNPRSVSALIDGFLGSAGAFIKAVSGNAR